MFVTGRPIAHRARGHKPTASITGEQLGLLQWVSCRRISFLSTDLFPFLARYRKKRTSGPKGHEDDNPDAGSNSPAYPDTEFFRSLQNRQARDNLGHG
jgi:hypothetical protein